MKSSILLPVDDFLSSGPRVVISDLSLSWTVSLSSGVFEDRMKLMLCNEINSKNRVFILSKIKTMTKSMTKGVRTCTSLHTSVKYVIMIK